MDEDGPKPEGDKPAKRTGWFRRAARGDAPKPPKRRRSRGFGLSGLSVALSLLLVGAFVGMAAFIAVLVTEQRPGPLQADKTVILTRDDNDGPIADQLEKAGVVENSTFFSLMTFVDGARKSLKRGEYEFPANVSMREVEEMLAHHRVVRHKLSIPEGLTSEQIVDRVREDDVLVGDIKEIPREGSLYPDTYVFERGDSRQALIAHMTAEMSKQVAEIWKKKAADLPIKSPGELVTLASIVEKETGKADERPRVAGVFINRLQKHMRLQSDPTIVYGLVFGKGTLGHPITRAELQEATPYNTYFVDGLPPGPICNPGRAALEAVANPARTKDLYFVADGTGGHAFAETLDQHQHNVAHWRQIEHDAKDHLSPDAAPANIRGEGFDLSGDRYGLSAPATAPVNGVEAFGALGSPPAATPADARLAARLDKIAQSRRQLAALTGAGGSLSPEKLANGSLDSPKIIVEGVNDPPPGFDSADMSDPSVEAGSPATSPVAPGVLADLRARKARYGSGLPVQDPALPVASPPDGPAGQAPLAYAANGQAPLRARAFDASEGTKLDPLRNKTYDLSFPKDISTSIR